MTTQEEGMTEEEALEAIEKRAPVMFLFRGKRYLGIFISKSKEGSFLFEGRNGTEFMRSKVDLKHAQISLVGKKK
ncbi:MAG TPA: hypothetical protein ENI19_04000 [Candidatus Nealsonbacteria bacterium]|nr:hypothetical protein [Candidatus Nealsonbacteria bacterium]HEB46831.1 hypothetical protein [Candidatus Nealsonbacteria bacterium]